jgi:hypothetical protein
MNPFGCFFAVVMFFMFGYGCIDQLVLSWNNPDATNRRLWLDHPYRMVFDTICVIMPMIAILILYPEDKKSD